MDEKKGEIKIDSHKLWWHRERVKQWIETGDCPPIYVEIGPTNICNHNCTFCGFDYARGIDTLETDILLRNIEAMGEFGVKSILFAGAGEPFLHKDFPEIVKKTKQAGIDVAFSTNCSLFDEEKAMQTLPHTSWIRLSIDAATPETHAKIHQPRAGNDFNTILENLRKIVELKKRNNYQTTLGVQFLLINENEQEVVKLAETCKEIGVDLLQVKPYSKHPPSIKKLDIDYSKFTLLGDKLNAHNSENFKVIFRAGRIQRLLTEKDYPHCIALPFWAMINERGDVVPCDLYYRVPELSYGNIYKQTFPEIWQSEKRKQVLEKIKQKGTLGCKEGCRADLINKDLWKLKRGYLDLTSTQPSREPPLHVNFI